MDKIMQWLGSVKQKADRTRAGHFLFALFFNIKKYKLGELSAQITYYLLLALFPFLIFLLGILSYTPLTTEDVSSALAFIMPAGSANMVLGVVEEVLDNQSTALFSFSMLMTLWSASKGAKALVMGINSVYEKAETRSFLITRGIALFLVIGVVFFVIMSLLFIVAGGLLINTLADWLAISASVKSTISILRYLIPVGMMTAYFTLLYRFVPNCALRFRQAVPGALFATAGWLLVSMLFSFYINHFANYARLYGSLGSLIILIVWLHLSSLILLVGAEINALISAGAKARRGEAGIKTVKQSRHR